MNTPQILTRDVALTELKRNGITDHMFPRFFRDCGDAPTYTQNFINDWLERYAHGKR